MIMSKEEWMGWIAAASVITFIVTLILIPIIIVAIPADYFSSPRRHPAAWRKRFPLFCVLLLLVRNLAGLTFVLMGVIMLLTPGQGVLTILVGLMLMNYPGKYQAERWLITRHSVWRFTNWLRHKASAQPLVRPEPGRAE